MKQAKFYNRTSDEIGHRTEKRVAKAVRRVMNEVMEKADTEVADLDYKIIHARKNSKLDRKGIDICVSFPLKLEVSLDLIIPIQVKRGKKASSRYRHEGIYLIKNVGEKGEEELEERLERFLSARLTQLSFLPWVLKKAIQEAHRLKQSVRRRFSYIRLEPTSIKISKADKTKQKVGKI